MVRLQAIRGIARHDRDRATELLDVMLADPRLSPILKWKASELRASLRSGGAVTTAGSITISNAMKPALTRRRWFRIGVVLLVAAQSLVWLFAGSLSWSFRGSLTGSTSSPRGQWGAYVAIAFFAVAVISLAVSLQFAARDGRGALVLQFAIQIVSSVVGLALTLLIDQRWILIVALTVPTLILLYLSTLPVLVTVPPTDVRESGR